MDTLQRNQRMGLICSGQMSAKQPPPSRPRLALRSVGKNGLFQDMLCPACPEVDVSGRLEGSDLSNPCWCLLTTEEARRDRPKDGRCRDVEVHEAGVTQPAQGEGPTLLESTATTAAGPVCRMPSYKPRPLLLIIARQPTSEVKIDTAK